ncbi:MAG TPA: glycosyltransferase family 2 protein [Sphingomicrobium sp.]
MTAPLVSVVVPVFNRRSVIREAIASLVGQTLKSTEIIIVDDGSSDGSAEAADRAAAGRARIIVHSANRGIPAARNTGLEAARGRYVAWLDSDDVARPRRLERQVKYLEQHQDIALVGSGAGRMTATGGRKLGARIPFRAHETLTASLLFRSPFQQSSITGRAEILKAYEYRAEFPVCEDLDMFIRLSRRQRLANLPQVLIDRRIHSGQIGRAESGLVRDRKRLLLSDLVRELDIEPTADELDKHINLGNPKKSPPPPEFMEWAEQWIRHLAASNARTGRYDERAFATVCARTWIAAAIAAIARGGLLRTSRYLCRSPLTSGLNADLAKWSASVVAGLAA